MLWRTFRIVPMSFALAVTAAFVLLFREEAGRPAPQGGSNLLRCETV